MTEQRNAALAKFAKQAEAAVRRSSRSTSGCCRSSPSIITAEFGEYGLWASYHTGLDFNGYEGQPIMAIANGVVTSAGYDGSYGNKTVVTLDDGTEIWYCHQSAFGVSDGDEVRAGEVIGYVGSTGNVTGSHLHLEVRPGGGDPVDPYAAFARARRSTALSQPLKKLCGVPDLRPHPSASSWVRGGRTPMAPMADEEAFNDFVVARTAGPDPHGVPPHARPPARRGPRPDRVVQDGQGVGPDRGRARALRPAHPLHRERLALAAPPAPASRRYPPGYDAPAAPVDGPRRPPVAGAGAGPS